MIFLSVLIIRLFPWIRKVSQFFCTFVCLSLYLSLSVSVCMSVCVFVCLSVYISVSVSVCLFVLDAALTPDFRGHSCHVSSPVTDRPVVAVP